METMYFGINIRKNKKFDVNNVAARLFICPRISPEHATKMLNLLINGKLSIESFIDRTDTYIEELSRQKENGDDIPYIMNNKLDAWVRTFKTPTHKDYEYLEKTFGFSKEDLLGTTAIETAKDTIKESVKDSTTLVKSAKEMAAYVKQFIKGQDKAIDKLSVPFYQHLDSKRKQYTSKIKTPVLVMGPTGVGKSEMFRIFGKICDCPVIRINSSEIVPAAWRGLHINDILAREINDNVTIKDMEYAIIVFHEFDKLTHFGQKIVGNSGTDMDTDMMRDIMRLFETEHSLHLENGFDTHNMSTRSYRLPVDNLLIVFDGAFSGITEIIKKRLNIGRSIGYSQVQSNKYEGINLQKLVTNEDLMQWGYMPELLGRIGECIVMNPLTSDVIYEIMTSAKDNILQSHIDFCSNNNVDLVFEEDAIRYIAAEAHKSGLGFRNVKTLLSKALNRLYYDLPEGTNPKKKLIINISKDYVMQNINVKQL